MSPSALVVTYHGIEAGPPPLFVEPALFEAHLEALAEAEATLVTVSDLVRGLRDGHLPPRAVALTFDDAFASVVSEAAPRLQRRGWPATVYGVVDYLGATNDWPTQPAAVPRRPLATAGDLAALAAAGFEIGAHTLTHAPLSRLAGEDLRRETVECRHRLEDLVGHPVRTFACPYGDHPAGEELQTLLEQTYDAVCDTRPDAVGAATDPRALPRVDAHYLRRPGILGLVARGRAPGYLAARRVASQARRLVRPDF